MMTMPEGQVPDTHPRTSSGQVPGTKPPQGPTVVVMAYYNRTIWAEFGLDLAPYVWATHLKGEYHAEHEYVSVWGAEVEPAEDLADYTWRLLQNVDDQFPLHEERSMSVGDVVALFHCDARPIVAWIVQPVGWQAVPEFFDRFK